MAKEIEARIAAEAEASALQGAFEAFCDTLLGEAAVRSATDGRMAKLRGALAELVGRPKVVLPRAQTEKSGKLGSVRVPAKRTQSRAERIEVAVPRTASPEALRFAIAAAAFEALDTGKSGMAESTSKLSNKRGTAERRKAYAELCTAGESVGRKPPAGLAAHSFAEWGAPIPGSPMAKAMEAALAALPCDGQGKPVVPGATYSANVTKAVQVAAYFPDFDGEAGEWAMHKAFSLSRQTAGGEAKRLEGSALTLTVTDHAGVTLATLRGVVLVKVAGKLTPESAAIEQATIATARAEAVAKAPEGAEQAAAA